jgi:hypothetical protein
MRRESFETKANGPAAAAFGVDRAIRAGEFVNEGWFIVTTMKLSGVE